jgi:hypothetical protein
VWNAERMKYGSCGDPNLYTRPQGVDERIVLITNLVYNILNAILDSVTGDVAWRLESQDWRDWEVDCFFIVGPPTNGHGTIELSPEEDDFHFHLADFVSRHQKC